MVFEYLTVLISVVVGLSVTSFLTNVVRIIHVRGDVTVSWVQLLWSIANLIWTIAFWWFTFVLAEQPQWTFFTVLLLFLCVDWIDYIVKLDKNVSIIGHLPYAAFVGSLIVLSLFALRTDNLVFHRIFALYSVLAVLVMCMATLVPLAN